MVLEYYYALAIWHLTIVIGCLIATVTKLDAIKLFGWLLVLQFAVWVPAFLIYIFKNGATP